MNVVTSISSIDIADRLPPLARERLDAIRQKAIDASATMKVRIEEISVLTAERRDLEGRRKQLTGTRIDPGFGLAESSSQVVEVDKRIERIKASIGRAEEIEKQRAAVWGAAVTVSRVAEDYVRSGVPRGCVLEDHPPIELALKKGEDVLTAVERVRRRGRELAADLHRVRSAPYPSAERKAAMRQQVDRWAEAGAPNASRSIAFGDDIVFDTDNVQVDVHSLPRTLGFFDQINTIATLAWFDREKLCARLDAALDEEATNDAIALTDADREKQEAVILGDLLATDRDECALIEQGAKQGLVIDHRSDVSPLALLGLSLVTPTRGLVEKLVG